MVGANIAKKTGIAVNLLPRPTYLSTTNEMMRPLAPATGLPTPPTSGQASEASPAIGSADTTTIAMNSLNGNVDPVVSSAGVPVSMPAVAAGTDVKPATSGTPGRRQFTWEDEAVLVELWKKYISEYFNGVRKRVLEKMTEELNAKFSVPPHFTVKQVNNKLHYMERRYRSLLDEFRNSGTPVAASDASVSVRASVERKFSLFYVVHDVLREVVETPHPLTPITPIGLTGATMQTRSGSAAGGVGDVASIMPDGMAVGDIDGLQTPSAATNDPMAITISPADLPDGVQAPEIPAVSTKRSLLPGGANGNNGNNNGSSPKRARTNTSAGMATATGMGPSTSESMPIAARVTGMVNRVVAISDRLLTVDRNERNERIDASKRATEVRLKEIALMEKHAALREQEQKNAEKKTKIEALKFIVENLNCEGNADDDANGMRHRTLRQLECLVVDNNNNIDTMDIAGGGEEENGNNDNEIHNVDNNDSNIPDNDNDIAVSRR